MCQYAPIGINQYVFVDQAAEQLITAIATRNATPGKKRNLLHKAWS
jgi:hypothetical protein